VNERTDLVIANSEAVRQDVLHTEGMPAEKVIVIHNGLETDRYRQPRNSSLRQSVVAEAGPVAVVVANFIAYKGHRYFLEAWSRVVASHPHAVALLAGDGPERPACEAIANELGISRRVRFLGTRHDVPALLAAADLLVHPSLEEGFCNAIVEAMAAGLPVVATSVGGNPEAVVDGETGYLVPPRDAAALAEAITRVWSRADGGRAMGQAGSARARTEFDVGRMVSAYETVYANLLARRGTDNVRHRRAR
jgi:glycosyltransferase involved in cell wall biosynthesis